VPIKGRCWRVLTTDTGQHGRSELGARESMGIPSTYPPVAEPLISDTDCMNRHCNELFGRSRRK
jgi:hypothetical protein